MGHKKELEEKAMQSLMIGAVGTESAQPEDRVRKFDDEPDQEAQPEPNPEAEPEDEVFKPEEEPEKEIDKKGSDPDGRQGSKVSGDDRQDSKEEKFGERASVVVQKMVKSKWNEAKLLDALAVCEQHEKPVVTLDSLVEAIGAEETDKPLMKLIMDGALEHSKGKEEEVKSMGLIDAIRIVGRIDANVRDILTKWRVALNKEGKVEDNSSAENEVSGPQLEERFRRIEDAVAGLTHKLQMTIGPAPPPQHLYPPAPPPASDMAAPLPHPA